MAFLHESSLLLLNKQTNHFCQILNHRLHSNKIMNLFIFSYNLSFSRVIHLAASTHLPQKLRSHNTTGRCQPLHLARLTPPHCRPVLAQPSLTAGYDTRPVLARPSLTAGYHTRPVRARPSLTAGYDTRYHYKAHLATINATDSPPQTLGRTGLQAKSIPEPRRP